MMYLLLCVLVLPFRLVSALTKRLPVVGKVFEYMYMYIEFVRLFNAFPHHKSRSVVRISKVCKALDMYRNEVATYYPTGLMESPYEVQGRLNHHYKIAEYFGFL